MAAESDSSQLSENFSKISVNGEGDGSINGVEYNLNDYEFGMPLKDVYRLAFNFYREKEGKAVHFSYEDKLQLVAYAQQVLHGPLEEAIHKLPPLGTLDVVGKDRRDAWLKLGHLPKEQARSGFVELLGRLCPPFNLYVEAHRREIIEREKISKEEAKQKQLEEQEKQNQEAEQKYMTDQQKREKDIENQIKEALNVQTFDQFRKYAEQQYPGDLDKQDVLIAQLQEKHYEQYIQQLQAAQAEKAALNEKSEEWNKDSDLPNDDKTESESDTLLPACIWTRPDIDNFKQLVSQAEGDGVVRVNHGETVTVRVPTHPDGSKLFWEFATDNFDIGFGVYFEYGTPTSDLVSVHVSESDDEDLDDLDDDEEFNGESLETNDVESRGSISSGHQQKSVLSEIVPVYRRDCQNEVYAGSHKYPGKGMYLLKFDNSYSLWRSKTLYYRVYYNQ